jgi:hypothetical protein
MGLAVQETLCRLDLLNFGLITLLVFKQDISEELQETLRRHRYIVVALPKNHTSAPVQICPSPRAAAGDND